ncbi:hypothetical protein SCUP234_07779 [Seiridium cupressi]
MIPEHEAADDAPTSTPVHTVDLHTPQSQHNADRQSSTQSYRLSPQAEEGIKAAVAATIPAKAAGAARWAIYKNILRWASLIISAAVIIAESLVAIFDERYLDTFFSIPWAVLVCGWDIWRVVEQHKQQGTTTISIQVLVGEGAVMISGLSAFAGFAYFISSRYWRVDSSRGSCLVIAIVVLTAIHTVLLIRACLEKHWGTTLGGSENLELPSYPRPPQTQPAQIIVQYLHTCPHCGKDTEPKPGEAINEELAARGEMQPQGLSPAQLMHVH